MDCEAMSPNSSPSHSQVTKICALCPIHALCPNHTPSLLAPLQYSSGRDASSFVDFLNSKCGTSRVLGGKLSEQVSHCPIYRRHSVCPIDTSGTTLRVCGHLCIHICIGHTQHLPLGGVRGIFFFYKVILCQWYIQVTFFLIRAHWTQFSECHCM